MVEFITLDEHTGNSRANDESMANSQYLNRFHEVLELVNGDLDKQNNNTL